MIEICGQERLAPHEADNGAEDGGHPQERDQAAAETDAGEGCEGDQSRTQKLTMTCAEFGLRRILFSCCTAGPDQAKLSLNMGT